MKKEQIILKVDSKNRITLPKKISESMGKLVEISIQHGNVTLKPLRTVSEDESWLFEPKNKTILAELKKSLKQKATINLGSFAQYLPKEKSKTSKKKI